MTEMKRVTVAIPDELDRKILEVKKGGSGRESYSAVVRKILDMGLASIKPESTDMTARQGATT